MLEVVASFQRLTTLYIDSVSFSPIVYHPNHTAQGRRDVPDPSCICLRSLHVLRISHTISPLLLPLMRPQFSLHLVTLEIDVSECDGEDSSVTEILRTVERSLERLRIGFKDPHCESQFPMNESRTNYQYTNA